MQRAGCDAPAQRTEAHVLEAFGTQRSQEVVTLRQGRHGPAVGPQAVQPAGQPAGALAQQKTIKHHQPRAGLEQARRLAAEGALVGARGVAGALHRPGAIGLRGRQAGAGEVGFQMHGALRHAGGGIKPAGDAVLHGHVGHRHRVQPRPALQQRARGGAGAAAQVDHAGGVPGVETQRVAHHVVHRVEHRLAPQRVEPGAPVAEVHVVGRAPGAVVVRHLGEVVLRVTRGDGAVCYGIDICSRKRGGRCGLIRHEIRAHHRPPSLPARPGRVQAPSRHEAACRAARRAARSRKGSTSQAGSRRRWRASSG